jgi:DNA helicase INO80
MSLSRILNDQPAPDPPRSELAASAPSPRPGSRASGSSTHVPEDDANQVAVRWEHYDPTVPQGGRPAAATVLEVEASASATPEPASATRSRNGHTAAENGTSASTGTRRKRKPVDVNGKQTTDEPSERRVRIFSVPSPFHRSRISLQYGLRRRPPKNKQYQPDSPTPNGTPEPPVQVEFAPTEEELRLASSDLEDTEEIWKPELEAYILDSHRRQKYVSEWFRNSSYVGVLTPLSSICS